MALLAMPRAYVHTFIYKRFLLYRERDLFTGTT
jgi:hypothetical protein